MTPLAGGFEWQHDVIARPTSSLPFQFSINYNSGNAFNQVPLQAFDPFQPAPLGAGWRHSFELRVLPKSAFEPESNTQPIGLLTADGSIETWDFLEAVGNTTRYKTRHQEYRADRKSVV